MKLVTLNVSEIIPYQNNPKKNENAVDDLVKSIQKDGYRARIIVDKDNVVIAGHTRLKAIKKLGWDKVEVWKADDMTDEQARDYRIRENYTAGVSQWDFDRLENEIKGLDFSKEDFNFLKAEQTEEAAEEPGEDYDGDGEDQISRLTHNTFENFERDFEPTYTGKYDIPAMQVTHTTGDRFLRFCDWRQIEDYENYIAHFYYDDFKFIKAWRDPDCYLDRLRAFRAIVAPDFSLYTDFPRTLQILSCYRRQWIGAYYQSMGIDVIPDVIWGDKSSYEFCFDGIPKGGTVAVSSVGVKRDKDWNGLDGDIFRDGYSEMMKRLEPETVLFYGDMIEGIEGNIIRTPSFYAERREMLNEKARVKKSGKRT